MGYPRKSYPHRCPPPCAKRSRPRACARVYIIYRSPVGRSWGVSAPLWGRGRAVVTPCPAPPSAGWGRARAKADAPSRSAPYLPAYGRAPAACVPNHCAQRRSAQGNPRSCPCVLPAAACLRPCTLPADGRSAVRSSRVSPPTATPSPACVPDHCAQWRKCTRQSPLLPVRTPRAGLPTAAPPPADGRSAVRRVGEGEGKGGRPLAQCRTMPLVCRITVRKGGRPLAQQPAPVCLRPRPRRLNGHPTSAGGRENDRMAHRRTTTPTHRTQRGNDTCTIRVPRRKGAQSVVHNL